MAMMNLWLFLLWSLLFMKLPMCFVTIHKLAVKLLIRRGIFHTGYCPDFEISKIFIVWLGRCPSFRVSKNRPNETVRRVSPVFLVSLVPKWFYHFALYCIWAECQYIYSYQWCKLLMPKLRGPAKILYCHFMLRVRVDTSSWHLYF